MLPRRPGDYICCICEALLQRCGDDELPPPQTPSYLVGVGHNKVGVHGGVHREHDCEKDRSHDQHDGCRDIVSHSDVSEVRRAAEAPAGTEGGGKKHHNL